MDSLMDYRDILKKDSSKIDRKIIQIYSVFKKSDSKDNLRASHKSSVSKMSGYETMLSAYNKEHMKNQKRKFGLGGHLQQTKSINELKTNNITLPPIYQ